jgi:hypothetical protein
MKRLLSVIALGAALGLSTMGFKNSDVSMECEATQDLSVVALVEDFDEGLGEIKGRIVNQSTENDYDEVMVRVEFHGADLASDDDLSDTDIDVERDIDVDVDGDDLDVDMESRPEVDADVDDTTLEMKSHSLGSQVYTVSEDVEAGEVEEFALRLTPPAGTVKVTTSVVCAD